MALNDIQYTTNKGFAEDLTEGKFSFPVVHGICKDRSNRQILSKRRPLLPHHLMQCRYIDVLQKRPTTPTLKLHTISYLRDHTKSFEYTLGVLERLEAQVSSLLSLSFLFPLDSSTLPIYNFHLHCFLSCPGVL